METEKIITGVVVKPLKKINNERGGLLEIQRIDDEVYPGFGQVYTTITFPNIIKAWYRHKSQIDQFVVLSGAMKLVLYDTQENSATKNIINEFILSPKEPTLVQVPPNIWHGFQSIDNSNLLTLHLNNLPQNLAAPDEERIAFNDPRIPYTW